MEFYCSSEFIEAKNRRMKRILSDMAKNSIFGHWSWLRSSWLEEEQRRFTRFSRVRHPVALEHVTWNYVILAISAICEGYSLYVAYGEFRKSAGNADDLLPANHLSKDPSIFAVLFEDSAAVLGLFIAFLGLLLSQLLEKPIFDGIASLLIGIVLIVASTLLANETRDLLIGEGARSLTLDRICELVRADPAVEAARRP